MQVLLIDDNRDFVTLNCSMLELFGYKTVAAYTGRDGIAAARKARPDVIICDIGLPDMDGYTVAKTLRNSAATKDCYLISLSGYAQYSDYDASKKAGFDVHLVKPADIMELISILEMRKAAGLSAHRTY